MPEETSIQRTRAGRPCSSNGQLRFAFPRGGPRKGECIKERCHYDEDVDWVVLVRNPKPEWAQWSSHGQSLHGEEQTRRRRLRTQMNDGGKQVYSTSDFWYKTKFALAEVILYNLVPRTKSTQSLYSWLLNHLHRSNMLPFSVLKVSASWTAV